MDGKMDGWLGGNDNRRVGYILTGVFFYIDESALIRLVDRVG